jgi:hypothetical protein
VSSVFSVFVILDNVWWYLIVILIYTYMTVKEV